MVVNVKTFSLLWDILLHMRKRRQNLFCFIQDLWWHVVAWDPLDKESYKVGIWVAFDIEGQSIMFISWSCLKRDTKLILLIFLFINLEQKVVIPFKRDRNFWVLKKKNFNVCYMLLLMGASFFPPLRRSTYMSHNRQGYIRKLGLDVF